MGHEAEPAVPLEPNFRNAFVSFVTAEAVEFKQLTREDLMEAKTLEDVLNALLGDPGEKA